jgi:uncharacterized membrane protein YfcA
VIFIYLLIAVGATIIGAIAGIGGGVIIKPMLDFIGDYSVSAIGVISSCTVFSMAVVSIIKQIRYKFKIEIRKTVAIGMGSVFGGAIGEKLLNEILQILSHNIVTVSQNIILAISFVGIFLFTRNGKKIKTFKVKNYIACLVIGFFLGILSSVLSIGGGPINIAVLTIFFSMGAKEAAVNSIITILFSQGAQLFTIASSRGVEAFNLPILPVMVIGGVLGGLIGSKLNKRFEDKVIMKVFETVLLLLIILNVYNVINSL